jgi:hypothetical protein
MESSGLGREPGAPGTGLRRAKLCAMEHAAFESPLSDEQLRELGRLVINCGFAEFLVNFHVGMLFRLNPMAINRLIEPLPTVRRVEMLKASLGDIPKSETRQLVSDSCKLIRPTIAERNALLHGVWGVDKEGTDAKPIVWARKDKTGFRIPADITRNADALAVASRKLKHAMTSGRVTEEAEKLVIVLA